MTTKLAHQTQKAAGIPNGMRTATVTAVSATGVTISVAGGQFSAGVGVLTSYAPLVGDTVAVFRQDSSWLILGPASAVNGWQRMSPLGYQNGWLDRGTGFPAGQFRVTASEVQLIGQLTNPASQGAGTAIVAGLPAPTGEAAGMFAMQGAVFPNLRISTDGILRINATSGTGIMQFCCSYPLDFLLV